MSRTSMSHVVYIDGSRHAHKCVMSYVWMRHVTDTLVRHVIYTNASRHILSWVTSQIRMSPVTRINASGHTYKESCHIHEWGMPYYMNESRHIMWMSYLTHINDSCHIYEWVTSHSYQCHVISYEWFISRIHQRIMPYTWMTYINVSCVNESCHVYVNESCHIHPWVMSCTWMSHFVYINASYHMYEWVISHTYLTHIKHYIN